MVHHSSFSDLVNALRPHIEEVDVHQLHQAIEEAQPVTIIDVREESEWAQGHIPKAIHLSKGVIERDIAKHVSDLDAPLMLYCGGGFRSILAADNLKKMGYTNVISVAGGWRDWIANYPIEQPTIS